MKKLNIGSGHAMNNNNSSTFKKVSMKNSNEKVLKNGELSEVIGG
jgi:hypothetical protein